MKLLLDENLASRLAAALSDLFPESRHVREVGLERADDRAIWDYARDNDFTILSKDSDFHQLSFVLKSTATGDLDQGRELLNEGTRADRPKPEPRY